MKTVSLGVMLCLLSLLPIRAATNNDRNVAEDFSEYVHLHRTRGQGISQAAPGVKRCAD